MLRFAGLLKVAHLVALIGAEVAPASTLAEARGSGGTALGCNAGSPNNRGWAFVDLVKQSMFGQPDIPGSQNVTVDGSCAASPGHGSCEPNVRCHTGPLRPCGWPTQDFSLMFYSEPGAYYYPAASWGGEYTVTAMGCATVSVPDGFPGITVVNQSCPQGNLLAFVSITSDGDTFKGKGALAFTKTDHGLKNLSMLLPGWPAGTDPETLNPDFLNNMKGRCSVTRFLGWYYAGHTDWDDVTPATPMDWSMRPKVGDPTYFMGGWGMYGLGVPHEIVAKIANAIDSDVWLNMPSTPAGKGVQEDGSIVLDSYETMRDEYVTNAIKLYDSLLPTGKKIFVEWGNECFFGNNQCYADDGQMANITVLQKGDPYKLNLGLGPVNHTENLNTWNSRMYSWTCLNNAKLAAAVVGKAAVGRADVPGVRVVPVLGANGGYAKDGTSKLSWLEQAWGPPAAAGLATMNIGAYVGANASIVGAENATTDAVIESLLENIARQVPTAPRAYVSAFAGYAAVSAYYGVAIHAYEGGPSTAGGKGAGLMAVAKANADPRMADAVFNIVQTWQQWFGGDAEHANFNYFTLGAQPLEQPWGSFTNLWDITNQDTPKNAGINRIVSSVPAKLLAGWPAPMVNHSAAFRVGYYTKDGLPPDSVVTWLPENSTSDYLVRFDAPCKTGIKVTLYMTHRSKSPGGDPVEVSIGAFLPPVTILSQPANGSRHDWTGVTATFPNPPTGAALANGLIAVRLRVPKAGVTYEWLSLDTMCA